MIDQRRQKNIHVVKEGYYWKVKKGGAIRSSGNFRTQAEAFDFAREMAKKTGQEVVLHKENGRIRNKYSCGVGPYPPKG